MTLKVGDLVIRKAIGTNLNIGDLCIITHISRDLVFCSGYRLSDKFVFGGADLKLFDILIEYEDVV